MKVAAAGLALLAGACAALPIKSLTQSDRQAASRRAAEKERGAVISEAELDQMDLDRTFVCDTESVAGSHLKRYQCRTLRRVQRERELARAFVEGSVPRSPVTVLSEAGKLSAAASDDLMATNKFRLTAGADAGTRPDSTGPELDPRFPPL